MRKLLLALSLAVPIVGAQAKDMTPVESRDLPSAKSMKSGPYDLPIITWGGDIATIHCSGNQHITQDGSICKNEGLKFKLNREDVFENQLKKYISGSTPYLRGTMSMINMAAAAVKGNDDLTPVVFYQLTWSAGGDALVTKRDIKKVADLCGKTIVLNADGPHLYYAHKVLSDAGCDISNNKFVWTKDLTGTDDSPSEIFRAGNVDAAFVIIPDALALSSGGNVGDGSEDSVRGAHIMLSTKTANRIIADVYAVRKDYFKRNLSEVENLASALFKSQDELTAIVKNKGKKYQSLLTSSAEILLDAAGATADAEGLLLDAEIAGFTQNVEFFQNTNNLRNFEKIVRESAAAVKDLGVIKSSGKIEKANFNYAQLASGATTQKKKKRFNKNKVARIVEKRQQQNSLDSGTIFEFEIFFQPNQNSFDKSLYEEKFNQVMEMAATYAGAVITIEGHTDPLGYLRKKKANAQSFVLNQTKQSAKNLSLSRAQAVRNEIIDFGESKKIAVDESQFAVIGHGISMPKTGICGSDPCPPKTKQEWRSNMRVVFRIIQVEAEEDVFIAL
ncbi:MAG: nitrate ABC transporter substrate-binding protein [Alteromonadaceae bacterium]|nr:MAG: nitrate ABC transporter substrate-binding protein [Alteromonadaceae bacterium]